MNVYDRHNAELKMNLWASQGIPFLVICDFDLENILLYHYDELPKNIQFSCSLNDHRQPVYPTTYRLESFPETFESYQAKFNWVIQEINYGNSYLLNLCSATPIETNLTLKDIYHTASAKYKLLIDDQFVVFSPECFIKIKDGKIFTFPMKGTIDAGIPNAKEILLSDEKEKAEHATIVDLLRNDLSMVAKNVNVDKFMYLDEVQAGGKNLIQASSQISGDLPKDYLNNFGSIFLSLLPAGSVTGAPKQKTIEIIKEVEGFQRNYYTGVFGFFDGKEFDSGVMIRFIEKQNDGLVYKSGGGITFKSNALDEYNEMKKKIYVPIHRNHKNQSSHSGESSPASEKNAIHLG